MTLAEALLRLQRKPEALTALRRAVELNPANRRQLPLSKAFEPLLADPAFKQVLAP